METKEGLQDMSDELGSKLDTHLNRASAVVTLIGSGFALFGYILHQLSQPDTHNLISGLNRINTTLILGGFAMVAYGLFWSVACQLFDWSYGEGAKSELPQGWEAVVLSLCTTLPLAILPALFELITREHLTLSTHWRASVFMIVAAAVAHLLLYGTRTPRIRGLRDRIFPQGHSIDLGKSLVMEITYAAVHFTSTVFVYRIALHYSPGISDITSSLLKTLESGTLFLIGAFTYIVVRYPASLGPVPVTKRDGSIVMDDQWAAMRGVVNGAILMATFMIGILL